VNVDTSDTAAAASILPVPPDARYLSVETDGPRLRFVDSHWPGDEAGLAALNAWFPKSRITTTALNLREILVTLLANYKTSRS
jgi:hypothetical protein